MSFAEEQRWVSLDQPQLRAAGRSSWSLPLIVVPFLLLKSFGLNPALSVENLSFYAVTRMSEGVWPYGEFFFSRPPLHLVPGWLLSTLTGGLRLVAMKLLPVFAATVTGVLVFDMTRRLSGVVAAIAATVLFYFSYDVLVASSHWTGANWATMWLMLGATAATLHYAPMTGVFLGMGICTSLAVVPVSLVVLGLLCLQDRRSAARALASAVAVVVAVNAVFAFIGGPGYFAGIFAHPITHGDPGAQPLADLLSRTLFHSFFLLAGPLFALPLAVLEITADRSRTWPARLRRATHMSKRPPVALVLFCTAVMLVHLLFLAAVGDPGSDQLQPVLPFAAVCGGVFVQALALSWRAFARSWRARRRVPRSWLSPALLSCAVVFGVVAYPACEPADDRSPPLSQDNAVVYPEPTSPLGDWALGFFRPLFWGPERIRGARYSGVQRYLWHESSFLGAAVDMADYIRETHAGLSELFGDARLASLVAVLANARVIDDFVDTTEARLQAGVPSEAEAVSRLQTAMNSSAGGVQCWAVVFPEGNLARRQAFADFFARHFVQERSFFTRDHGRPVLLRHRGNVRTRQGQ